MGAVSAATEILSHRGVWQHLGQIRVWHGPLATLPHHRGNIPANYLKNVLGGVWQQHPHGACGSVAHVRFPDRVVPLEVPLYLVEKKE
jgi:hypothetical protein